LLTPEVFQPLRAYSASYHAGAAGRTAASNIFNFLDLPVPTPRVHVPARCSASAPGIRFEGVSFSYEAGARPALCNASFEMSAGATTVLRGVSGAGKSTVAGLLMRFFEPDSGQIIIDGSPLAGIDQRVWLEDVAWVPQLPHLFDDTVAGNIGLGRPDAPLSDVVGAACAAGADDFIRRLPQGYDTRLGERAFRLSGGQRQRIALARAFLKDSPVVVLDEPDSHIDIRKRGLDETLRRLCVGRTVLLILHGGRDFGGDGSIVTLDRGRVISQTAHCTGAESGVREALVR
jgi:ATP-binding cassette subfamily C protein CydD